MVYTSIEKRLLLLLPIFSRSGSVFRSTALAHACQARIMHNSGHQRSHRNIFGFIDSFSNNSQNLCYLSIKTNVQEID